MSTIFMRSLKLAQLGSSSILGIRSPMTSGKIRPRSHICEANRSQLKALHQDHCISPLPCCFKLCPWLDRVVEAIGVGLSFTSMYPSSVFINLVLKSSVYVLYTETFITLSRHILTQGEEMLLDHELQHQLNFVLKGSFQHIIGKKASITHVKIPKNRSLYNFAYFTA